MTDEKFATAALDSLAKTLGVALPVNEMVQLSSFLVSKLRGATWSDAIQAGVDARQAIDNEAAAERSRRERMGKP